ncbi:alpha/beta hydrolase [Emticicia sp. 21SJ11W-3]|uniref:alpha/beta hydrolase n=1 Tax=Emticicia sp. 21SJ11W-3 TaxID=2916755 RepID=UPI0020A1AF07|nr:acyl-CoA thioester hydrolase/BAAT C-terminal domain-containing protein [Emticicia sp. 21SJ11W-3]UTA69527.1 acetylxylan esterase [Emticicia sp. 21SJ11W-3]
MKSSFLVLSFILAGNVALAQYNPEKPDLRQGRFYTEEQAAKVHQDLAQNYSDKKSWEKRAALIRQGILEGSEFNLLKVPKASNITIHSKKEFNGYSVENVSFQSLNGIYVTGNLYRPMQTGKKMAGVLCPHGHGQDPRLKEYTQQRCATLARMGAVVFAYDMIGMGDMKQCDHKIPKAVKLQLANSTAALNFLLSQPNIDKERIGMTGESGGGTQTFLLAAIDKRIKVSVPVVMVSAYFFGGCICESGMPIHKRPTHETTNVEIAALAAPRPMLLVSDGGDWTKNTPNLEYPYIKRIYSFYGAEDKLENVHLPDEKHDYGISKRLAAYEFLARHLKLDINKVKVNGKIDESINAVLSPAQLQVFDASHPLPADALKGDEAVIKLLN